MKLILLLSFIITLLIANVISWCIHGSIYVFRLNYFFEFHLDLLKSTIAY